MENPEGNHEQISSCTISLYQCKCFEKLTLDERALLDANSVIIKYNKKENIFKQGALTSSVMFIEKGLAKVYVEKNGNSLVMMIVPEGNLIGLTALTEEFNRYQYSAMTYIDSSIRQIDLQVFRQLVSTNPEFAREIIDKIISDKIQVYGRFFCLTHKQAYGTVADIIMCLSNRIFKSREFHLPLSRQDLAELTGMSQETVIRILKKFSDDRLIQMDGKTFKVIDPDRLCQISETG